MRSALRSLRQPRFTLPVVMGLAFAIGATTSVFSVFSAMLIRTLGLRELASLVAVWRADEAHGQKSVELSYNDLLAWQAARDTVEDVALASSVNLEFPLVVDGTPERIQGTTVTGNFFTLLGATPQAGRLLSADDDRGGVPARAVLSHRLWSTHLGGDPSIVGRELHVGPGTVTVVGVARPEFDFPHGVDIWVPLHAGFPEVEKNADLRVFRSVARMRPGVSIARTAARLDAIARNAESAQTRQTPGRRVLITPMLDEIYGPARQAVWILLAAVLLVLLIACGNAANLLLNRAGERRQELAIRVAMGASRSRLAGLLIGESALLAAIAGALGLVLALAGIHALAAIAPADVPRVGEAAMDPLVLGFGTALTILTILFFGVGPAVMASRRDPNEALKHEGRGAAGGSRFRLRWVLIAGEGALSMFLLASAGWLVGSYAKLSAIDPGFRDERILTFRITLDEGEQSARRAFYGQVLDRVRALPGVETAAAVLIRPLSGAVGWDTVYTVEGEAPNRTEANPNGNYEAISPDYFRTMGIRMVAGRDFTAGDTTASPGVVIIDETTARRHWPNGEAVGKRLRLGANPKAPMLTVVGVVKPVRYREWQAAWPDLYIPYTQRAQHRSDFVVKTTGDPAALANAIRREVFSIDKNQPISEVSTMATLVNSALSGSRFNGIVLAALAGCALVLAAIGIYSVLSYAVTQRHGEIGIRMALGASPSRVATLITRDGVGPVLTGMAGGIAGAALVRHLLTSLLFGIDGLEWTAYVGAGMLLVVVALVACVGPAWRAAGIDPADALRSK